MNLKIVLVNIKIHDIGYVTTYLKWVWLETKVFCFPECRLNPTPGVCRDSERQMYWTFSQKTGTCVQLTGCYTIRDRNVWLTRQMCRNNCIKEEFEQRSSVLPNFLYESGKPADIGVRRGRRGRIMTRNTNPGVDSGNQAGEIIVTDILTTFDITATNSGPNQANMAAPLVQGPPKNTPTGAFKIAP